MAIMDHGQVQQTGIALGVDESACLLLQTSTEIVRIHSGDVSLRALA
ncbi:MAG: hypothetical protein K2P84_13165 [Undibacterium sp.]|nr:hypothetical protein [Undibacterium sp.]